MNKYIGENRLTYLWGKIKAFVSNAISGKVDKVSSSTDNAVVRFDGTSGNIQNSGVTINDSNHLTAAKLITSGGTSSQFVKGDGTLDSNTYATESYVQNEIDTLTDGTAASESGNVIDIGEYDLMKINEVKGKSLVMNQLWGKGYVGTHSDVVVSYDATTGLYNLNGTATANVNIYNNTGTGRDIKVLPPKHKGLFITGIVSGTFTGSSESRFVGGFITHVRYFDEGVGVSKEIGSNNNSYDYPIIRFYSGDVFDNLKCYQQCIDLTQMFGAGNEPTTVEEVEAILGNDYYEYNTGEVVGNNVEKLDVYDSNDTKKGSLALNLTELTGKVNGDGTSVTIFPDGLHGVGTAYDSLIVDDDGYARKAVKRMGSVDLGSLSWSIDSSYSITRFVVASNSRFTTSGVWNKCICDRYSLPTNDTGSKQGDKTIKINSVYCIIARDDSYSTAADFKTAMDGVMLYYELATPIEYVLDTPVQCVAKVYPNGTVKQVPVMPDSTPMVMDVTYLHDNGGMIGGLIGNYATKEYVDNIVGDIETLLASI